MNEKKNATVFICGFLLCSLLVFVLKNLRHEYFMKPLQRKVIMDQYRQKWSVWKIKGMMYRDGMLAQNGPIIFHLRIWKLSCSKAENCLFSKCLRGILVKIISLTATDNDLGMIYSEYQQFVSTFQVKCQHEKRCGPEDDSGYNVCIEAEYKPRKPCLVYSFGSLFVFGFEIGVKQEFGCEIHTFDPSVPIAGHNIPNGINFHLIGLSDTDSTNDLGWKMRQLSTIRKSLNHTDTTLDILKLDIEGYEWKAIPNIISSGGFSFVRQLVIELHFGKIKSGMGKDGYMTVSSSFWGDVKPSEQLDVLKQLQYSGFQVFYFENNPRTKIRLPESIHQSLFACNVISLININFKRN